MPRVGMLATVRNRRALVTAVDPFQTGPGGTLHLVSVEYTDADGPPEDRLIWEREPGRDLLEPSALPRVSDEPPMPGRDFDALVRATRWSALSPYVDPDGTGLLDRLPVSAPFHGAVQVEGYQLFPLLMALRRPRVCLMLADDVGLGKTIEAGLLVTELLLRRRIRRVLILCPASLRRQWRSEMLEKFALPFDIVDRAEGEALHRRAGLDANPWRSYPRIITSYHYLKQPDVLESFRAACRVPEGSPSLPWDLLIVDEAHNLAPAPIGEDSDVSRMLAAVAPQFEHRLFLTATPHNGYTRSFSGLLELLDPVRFTRTTTFSPAEQARIKEVVIRRLKREINQGVSPRPFCERRVEELPVTLSPQERALSDAFHDFRRKVRSVVAARGRAEQLAGAFAVEVLNKRLLSCPTTFADSWWRYRDGMDAQEDVDVSEVAAARRAVADETDDDREAESRAAHAAVTVGAWLHPLAAQVADESHAVDQALAALGLGRGSGVMVTPGRDGRWEALLEWIDGHLRHGARGSWREDERLVIFTEYKTTLDHLVWRLKRECGDDRILQLFGGMDDVERDTVKASFNDPTSSVRILVATDAASEGLNLQDTARYLIHYDIPWNPARLEQRNGRLDRHGQARDVDVWHFTSHDSADIAFMAYVAHKVDQVREDLGSTGEVFDGAVQRRLVAGEDEATVRRDLDADVERARGRAGFPATDDATAADGLGVLRAELDLDADTLRGTLEVAVGAGIGLPRFESTGETDRVRLLPPIPPRWQELVDDTLRLPARNGGLGPLPRLAFDPESFIDTSRGRPVFRQPADARLVHLGHPLYHRALALFARARFPGGGDSRSRWTVRSGGVPDGVDALILLTVEEVAVNELRETFHHWVRTYQLPVMGDRLGSPLEHLPAATLALPAGSGSSSSSSVARAQLLWDALAMQLRDFVVERTTLLTEEIRAELDEQRGRALAAERERFASRLREVSLAMNETSMARLEREIEDLRRVMSLFSEHQAEIDRARAAKEEELARRRGHYGELHEQLQRERDRVIGQVIPKRHALRQGAVRVFPVAVEIRLPEEGG